jgi:hypothetical protein
MQDVSWETRKTQKSLICNQQVAGSNPIASSRKFKGLRGIVAPSFFCWYSPGTHQSEKHLFSRATRYSVFKDHLPNKAK